MLPCPATQEYWIKVKVCKPAEVFMENEATKRSSTAAVLSTEGWPKPFTYPSSYSSPEWASFCNASSKISIAGAWIPLIHLTTGYNPTKIKSNGSHILLWRHPCSKATTEVSFISFGICEREVISFFYKHTGLITSIIWLNEMSFDRGSQATNWISCRLHGRRMNSSRNTEASELILPLKGKSISVYLQKLPPLLSKTHWDSMEGP